jgi:cytochrome c2
MTETMTARASAWRPIQRLGWLAVAVSIVMVPDTSMSFIGLRSKADRDAVIAYPQTVLR